MIVWVTDLTVWVWMCDCVCVSVRVCVCVYVYVGGCVCVCVVSSFSTDDVGMMLQTRWMDGLHHFFTSFSVRTAQNNLQTNAHREREGHTAQHYHFYNARLIINIIITNLFHFSICTRRNTKEGRIWRRVHLDDPDR